MNCGYCELLKKYFIGYLDIVKVNIRILKFAKKIFPRIHINPNKLLKNIFFKKIMGS